MHRLAHLPSSKPGQRVVDLQPSMMDQGDEEQQAQHHYYGMHRIPMHLQMPVVFGYPVDPNWHNHMMMQPQMHLQHMYPHPMDNHGHGDPFAPGIPGLSVSRDPLEMLLGPFPCARLRNMPFDSTIEDILVLFQGLVVIDVVHVEPGEAYILFANPMDYQMGLQRDRQGMGRNMIEITPSSRAEYYKAISAQQWHEPPRQPMLPMGTGGMGLSGTNDLLDVGDGAGWGSSDAVPSMQALSGGHGETGHLLGSGGSVSGGGSVGTAIGMAKGNNPGRPGGPGSAGGMKRSGGGIQVGEHTGFLRMRGLPFSATKEDIFAFFKAYCPVLETIVLTFRSDGRATGEAYVGFETPDDSKRAMDLHRKSMGSRYIELFLSNKDEHGRALARFGNR